MLQAEELLPQALEAFGFGAFPQEVRRHGNGHINDSFRVTPGGGRGRFLLQRISSVAFPRPDLLMENIVGITRYLAQEITRRGGDPLRETLTVIPTLSGESYFTDSQGGAWRVYRFIEDTICMETAETPEHFAQAGLAFGRFQRLLSGYPVEGLHETIARFHDTPNRLEQLVSAAKEDKLGRLREVTAEYEFLLARSEDCAVAQNALNSGLLPIRVTHNDAKLGNILLDRTTGRGLCVIDLDTVMPGLAIYDFGDSIRSGANRCAEDEPDAKKAGLDINLFRVYTEAFLKGAEGALTPEELQYLPWGAKLMTMECAIRFLTDYLQGDVYYRIARPRHNLDRCRTQIGLTADMERHWEQMRECVQETQSKMPPRQGESKL